jgi:hypothetical protein
MTAFESEQVETALGGPPTCDVLAAGGVRETRKDATAAAISAVLYFKPH